jgi:surface-anchored protein
MPDLMKMMVAAVAVSLAFVQSPTPGAPDPGLDQSVDPNQSVASGRVVLESGHVDLGPRYRDGTWTVQIHDDTVVPSVWRQLPDTVLRVRDAAVERVPDDPAYAFIGQSPGTPVHVLPQTQNRDVVWMGWNTQDPGVLESVARGVTMNLLGVQGPGDLVVYLQSGNLGAPQVLWQSTKAYPQPLWVESNTHTHANWVFAKPGVYLVAVEIVAELVDGQKASGRDILRFAVGDGTSVDEAFGVKYAGNLPSSGATPAAGGPSGSGDDGGPAALVWVLVAAVVVLAAAVIWLLVRGANVRRRALAGGPDDD